MGKYQTLELLRLVGLQKVCEFIKWWCSASAILTGKIRVRMQALLNLLLSPPANCIKSTRKITQKSTSTHFQDD